MSRIEPIAAVGPIETTGIRIILLDIEGTTTPGDFVCRTLFGYARANLSSFLGKTSRQPEVRDCIVDLKAQHALDQREGQAPPPWNDDSAPSGIDSAARYGLWLMDRDSKAGPLKALQGLIWQEGYDSGALHGEVYPDVPPAFYRWRRRGTEIAIYSSGSTLAQQKLFRSTKFGDLTASIKSFFDTRVGTKRSRESYDKIALVSGHPTEQFLFLSDTSEELDAACAAGMQATLVVRTRNVEITKIEHPTIATFDQIP